jgi:hypothetical protein
MTTRIFNVLVGTWLFLSAFAWPHTHGQEIIALVCGALTIVLSLATIYFSGIRYFTAVVAVMLFVSALTFPTRWTATFWHNAIIAVAIFVAALVDRGSAGARHERQVYGRA